MSRRRGVVEIGVMVGSLAVLAGCASGKERPWLLTEPDPRGFGYADPPDGVDYLMAVQCGALLWAQDSPDLLDRSAPPGTTPFSSNANTYLAWAELSARRTGADPGFALPDMAIMRDDLLAGVDGATPEERRAALDIAYTGELAACASTAEHADVIWIRAGG